MRLKVAEADIFELRRNVVFCVEPIVVGELALELAAAVVRVALPSARTKATFLADDAEKAEEKQN